MKEFKFYASYIIVGLLCSCLSAEMFSKIGFPTIPELIFLPILYLRRKDFILKKPIGSSILLSFLFVIFFVLIAVLYGKFALTAILTTARAYLCVLIFMEFGKTIVMNDLFYKIMFIVSVSSIIGWALVIIMKFMGLIPFGFMGITYGNMVAIPLCIAFSFIYKPNFIKYSIIFGIVAFLCFTAALRRLLLVSLLSLGVSFLLTFLKKMSMSVLLAASLTIAVVVQFMPIIESYVQKQNSDIYMRVFSRTSDALSGNYHTGDEERVGNFFMIYDNIDDLLFPHGFVSKRANETSDTGVFVDSPFYELFYTYGIFLVLCGMLLFIIKYFVKVKSFFIKETKFITVWLTSGAILFMLLFIDSTFITYTYTSAFTGIVLGAILRKETISCYETN